MGCKIDLRSLEAQRAVTGTISKEFRKVVTGTVAAGTILGATETVFKRIANPSATEVWALLRAASNVFPGVTGSVSAETILLAMSNVFEGRGGQQSPWQEVGLPVSLVQSKSP